MRHELRVLRAAAQVRGVHGPREDTALQRQHVRRQASTGRRLNTLQSNMARRTRLLLVNQNTNFAGFR